MAKKRVLVRCAGCGHNFESDRHGRLECPTCHAQIWLEPVAGLEAQPVDPPALDAPSENVRASAASTPERSDPGAVEAEAPTGAVGAAPEAQVEPSTRLRKRIARRPSPEPTVVIPAWEEDHPGLLVRFTRTLKQVLFDAQWFFAGIEVDRAYRALSFAWIVGTIGFAFFSLNALWQLSLSDEKSLALLRSNPAVETLELEPKQLLEIMRDFYVYLLVGSPLFSLLNLWVSAGLNHLGVLLVSRRNRGFWATFRASAYGLVPLLATVIPFVGFLLGFLGTLGLQVIAIGQVHRIRFSRASLAVLLPLVTAMALLISF